MHLVQPGRQPGRDPRHHGAHTGTAHTHLTAAEPHGAHVEAGTPRPNPQGADPPTLVPTYPLLPAPPSLRVVIQKLRLHFVNLCRFCHSSRGRERQQTPLTNNASVTHQKSSPPNAVNCACEHIFISWEKRHLIESWQKNK